MRSRGSTIRLKTPPSFSFLRTIYSHGWFDLPPFHWDDDGRVLHRVMRPGSGKPLVASITSPRAGVLHARLHAGGAGNSREAAAHLRRIFRLDETLDPFYSRCDASPSFHWVSRTGAGRLLRAPEPFEDLVKLICTTNCTWALTRVMVDGLVTTLGKSVAAPSGFRRGGRVGVPGDRVAAPPAVLHAFPTPGEMAAAPLGHYVRRVRAGYRASFLKELAGEVASGERDLSSWLDPDRPDEELRREIGSVKGAGRYVVDNMMKLLGRYEGMGIDSWCRRRFSQMHARGRRVSDRTLERYYAPFGPYRGLALWCDITRDWFDEEGASLAQGVTKY